MDAPQQSKATVTCLGVGVVVALVVGTIIRLATGSIVPAAMVTVFLLIIPVAVGITALRQAVAAGAYTVTLEPLPAVAIGRTIELRGLIQPRRSLVIGPVRAVLRCQEHAISRGGTSDTHYRQTIVEQTLDLAERRKLSYGEAIEVRARFSIPATAIPSFQGQNNSIEWTVTILAPVPGWCPDIKQELALRVVPQIVATADRSLSNDPTIPATWAGDLKLVGGPVQQGTVQSQFEAYRGPLISGVPALRAGGSQRLELRVLSTGDIHCRGLRLWVGCRIHGSGSEEKIALVNDEFIHEGDLTSGTMVTRSVEVAVPEGGPVSFAGRYVKCDWIVRVRVDIPIWRDKCLDLPLVVTPHLLAGRD